VTSALDAVVVGSGPNGLAAAIELARAGLRVEVVEGAETPGGGCRTAQLTEPGYRHDVCSTIQSMVALSPFFRGIDLDAAGVRLVAPAVALAHPLGGERAASVVRDVATTAAGFGPDARAYERLLGPLVEHRDALVAAVLAPLRSLPRDPLTMARFAASSVPSATHLVKRFTTGEARALLGGVSAHAMLPLSAPLSAAFGVFLTVTAHAGGWPVVEGGSGRLVDALVAELAACGGSVTTGRWVRDWSDLPASRVTLFDTSVESMVEVAGDRLGARYRRALARFAHGPGVCKVDWALSGPVPWTAPVCRDAATVHVGGTFEEVALSEADVAAGRHPSRPFCIVVQAGVADPSRAPAGHATLWAYCHVPRGSSVDMTSAIEDQIERFAPGFRDLVVARTTTTAADASAHNPNYIGGDITGGAGTLRQTIARPTAKWNPYRTGTPGVYLCSASTPPGGGVHGMCGVGAARAALADLRRGRVATR